LQPYINSNGNYADYIYSPIQLSRVEGRRDAAMTRVAIYTRVSTEDQAKEGFSLDAQKERLRMYCKAQAFEVVAEYVDDGHSGRSTNRPAYQRMMAAKETWDSILVVKMDRIHRNSRNFMDMMDDLNKWGKGFASMTENLDTTTAMGRFVMDIIQRIAQLESEQIGERVYMGMHQKAATVGGMMGGGHPYGYEIQDGKLIVIPDEAKVVKEIFEKYLEGMSTGKIVKMLTERKVPTKRGARWDAATIASILKNPIYAGFVEWDDTLTKGSHETIIMPEMFNTVQETLVRHIRRPEQRYQPRLLPFERLLKFETPGTGGGKKNERDMPDMQNNASR
jgi:site-specific DNA recombinase